MGGQGDNLTWSMQHPLFKSRPELDVCDELSAADKHTMLTLFKTSHWK